MTGRRAAGVRSVRDVFAPAVGYPLLAVAAVGYSVVAGVLALARARPMPDPFLPIGPDVYFRWGALFYAPVIVVAWLLACGVVLLLSRTEQRPDVSRVLAATAAAVGLGTAATLLPDLVTSPLRAAGVIDEQAWERSIQQHGGWFVFTWCTLSAYLVVFLVAFPAAVRHGTGLRGWRSVVVGVAAFVVLQGFELVFIR
jgi:hypothetical protein